MIETPIIIYDALQFICLKICRVSNIIDGVMTHVCFMLMCRIKSIDNVQLELLYIFHTNLSRH